MDLRKIVEFYTYISPSNPLSENLCELQKMLNEHFDYLLIEVSFTEKSYPKETSYFPDWGWIYTDGLPIWSFHPALLGCHPPPVTTNLMMILSLTITDISMIWMWVDFYWIKMCMFGYGKTSIMVNIDNNITVYSIIITVNEHPLLLLFSPW